ncbi:helix-turn-helix transcriptional regulator [uncultured Roseobacter sp.]|uniref:helix-turn-helix domain-containing protein n=1 Tax=uncultured Roseobacter sp. TaxID=114847 RepID=UPI0026292A5D|nr:helix-turn-helix transcriptional regulator [uncultured Roseobacter sp.]
MGNQSGHKCSEMHVRECVGFDASHLLGAPFPVTLYGGVGEKYCGKCGAVKGHIIKDPMELIAMVAVLRACDDMKLNGSEVKFLRKSMSYKAKDLAHKLDLDPAHLSRIENDKKPMSLVYEKLLRAAVCLKFIETAKFIGVDVSHVLSMNITSAKCVSKIFDLHLCLVEKDNVLRLKSHGAADGDLVRSWEGGDPKLAI